MRRPAPLPDRLGLALLRASGLDPSDPGTQALMAQWPLEALRGDARAKRAFWPQLRALRKRAPDGTMIAVSASDPLNLLGGIVAGEKVPRQPGARLLWRDGLPLATLVAGEFRALPGLDAQDLHAAKVALLRDPATGPAQPAGSRPMADPLGLHR